jgi:HD superfamily phosphohydrolase
MRLTDPIPLTRSMVDPVHGVIRLSDEELQVVDHSLFRRLHAIRQNGLLYLVFPSASHTRFEHSLGVLHQVDAILRALMINSFVATRKPSKAVAPLSTARTGEAVDLTELGDDEVAFLFRVARLAALVHDMGHGPFSHTFDSFAPEVSQIRSVLRSDPRLSSFGGSELDLEKMTSDLFDATAKTRVEHEMMSCIMFAVLWSELHPTASGSDAAIPAAVAAVILGKPALFPNPSKWKLLTLAHDLVASSPIDADRMDYLERDSRSLGVSYGLYDRNRLLKSMLAFVDSEGHLRLGFKASGLRAVENFVQARFELFVQVYYHKTNRAVERMLQAISTKAAKLENPLFRSTDLEGILEVYREVGDVRFLRILRGLDPEFQLENAGINEIAADIHGRRLWKRIFEGQKPEHTAQAHASLLDQDPGGDTFVDHIDPKATKGLDAARSLLRRVQGDGFYTVSGETWLDASPLINSLKEEEHVSRIYLKSGDRERAAELRKLTRPKPSSK